MKPWNYGLQMKSPQWKGGETRNSNGRIMILMGYNNNGRSIYRLKSRVVMEKIIDRPLKKNEYVHHIDGNKSNDKPNNLQICTPYEHNHIHRAWER